MLSQADKDWIKANSAEVIGGSGESITRRRLDTSERPASFDEDLGEVVDKSEESYDEVTFTGKVLWAVTEKLLAKDFGGVIEADAVVHVPIAVDVAAQDYLVMRDVTYTVVQVAEAPLAGFRAVAVRRGQG